jgi:hypothetical protein
MAVSISEGEARDGLLGAIFESCDMLAAAASRCGVDCRFEEVAVEIRVGDLDGRAVSETLDDIWLGHKSTDKIGEMSARSPCAVHH